MAINIIKLFGLGVALVTLALATGNSGQVGLAQAGCTITVQAGQSVQQAIDRASAGAVVCLSAGTFQENIEIGIKSLMLRGMGWENTIIRKQQKNKPVISIGVFAAFVEPQIQVVLEGVTISGGEGADLSGAGISIQGESKVTLNNSRVVENAIGINVFGRANEVSFTNSQISGNEGLGLRVHGAARVSLSNVQISGNKGIGLLVFDSDQVSVTDSEVSKNSVFAGLWIEDSRTSLTNIRIDLTNIRVSGNEGYGLLVAGGARVSLTNSIVSDNQGSHRSGIHLKDSALVTISNSQVSGNKRSDGLTVKGQATLEVRQSIFEGNGTDQTCQRADLICNGLRVEDQAQLKLIDSVIRSNADWGPAAILKSCGFLSDSFTGQVIFEGNNTIENNNKSGKQNGKGNPGNHPFKNLPDGQVCLP